jgi:metalloendopeptidase OMA1, mitochondrial
MDRLLTNHVLSTLLAFFLLASVGCRTTPITGRSQLLLVPEQQEIAMGLSAFEETKSKEPLTTNQAHIELVQRVGQRIAAVADRPDYQWEFRVIASSQQNAYCLPGGKVSVHEGILPVCANEAGLAVVMSHEIAHALARHGGERMSHSLAVEGVKHAVDYVTKDREERQRQMIMQAYGLGTQYGVILPYSRKHENEADHMGLMLMAQAGYDPAEAPRFWERFAKAKASGAKTPEFLSTHPSDEHRVDNLTALLPEARTIYDQCPAKFGLGEILAGSGPQAPLSSAGSAPTLSPTATVFPAFGTPAGSTPLFPPPFAP